MKILRRPLNIPRTVFEGFRPRGTTLAISSFLFCGHTQLQHQGRHRNDPENQPRLLEPPLRWMLHCCRHCQIPWMLNPTQRQCAREFREHAQRRQGSGNGWQTSLRLGCACLRDDAIECDAETNATNKVDRDFPVEIYHKNSHW